jgi:hypothetical protein
MSTSTVVDDPLQTFITSDEALKIARLDAERIYRDLSSYRVFVELVQDGWHVDYELKNGRAQGGGAHYVIDAHTGAICKKKYEQ